MDAAATDAIPPAFFVEVGASTREARIAGVGLRWPGPVWRGGRLALSWELALNHWSVAAPGAHQSATQAVAMPMLRWRPGAGRVFVEGGIGLSVHDRPYVVLPHDTVSRWNFQDVLALGWRLGPGDGHEVSLRWSHVSNASLQRPNPGDDRLSLRWTLAF